jgi:hypothetical protein
MTPPGAEITGWIVRAKVDYGEDRGMKEEVISERFSSVSTAKAYRDLALKDRVYRSGKILDAWVLPSYKGKA